MSAVLRQYHVVCFDGKWKVIRACAKRATKSFATKEEAVEYVRWTGCDYVVHRWDGMVESKHEARFVQLRNPRTGLWVKIDREKGAIVDHKSSRGPYPDILVGN